uniref:Uncharacterized protein n=1 Tax=Ditylenchus dipsaci TaxID=166011 RepID=A0A915ELU4_9BILA
MIAFIRLGQLVEKLDKAHLEDETQCAKDLVSSLIKHLEKVAFSNGIQIALAGVACLDAHAQPDVDATAQPEVNAQPEAAAQPDAEVSAQPDAEGAAQPDAEAASRPVATPRVRWVHRGRQVRAIALPKRRRARPVQISPFPPTVKYDLLPK